MISYAEAPTNNDAKEPHVDFLDDEFIHYKISELVIAGWGRVHNANKTVTLELLRMISEWTDEEIEALETELQSSVTGLFVNLLSKQVSRASSWTELVKELNN